MICTNFSSHVNMAAKQVDHYRVFCKTENAYQYVWKDTFPTICPNNNTHLIDTDTVSIIDTVSQAAVEVVQQTGTGGNYTCQSFCFDIPANSTITKQYSWPYPVSISTMHFTSDATQTGDLISGIISPNTVIGFLAADLPATGTVLSVTPSVAQNAITGTLATVSDGTNSVDLGSFYNINTSNNTVCVQSAAKIGFAAAAPTKVMMSFQNISLEIGQPGFYTFGSQQLKGASMPANAIMQISYTNRGEVDKRFRCWGEMGY